MTSPAAPDADNGFELSVTRFIAAPPAAVWQVITERMAEWWCPKPWRATIVEQQLRAGGRSCITMHGPDGESETHDGVILECLPGRRLVFTDAFRVGWIPQGPFMVGSFELAPEGDGTRYTATARHWNAETCQQHNEMGFEAGWDAVAAQLAELAEKR